MKSQSLHSLQAFMTILLPKAFSEGGYMKGLVFLVALFLAVQTLTVQTQAHTPERFSDYAEKFYTIDETEIKEIPVDESTLQNYQKNNMHMACQDDLGGANLVFDNSTALLSPVNEEVKVAVDIVDNAGKVVDGIINIGKKVWEIISAGQPVVNLNMEQSANALPRGVRCWDELSNWQVPSVRSYSQTFKNFYGMEVISFEFDVIYTHSGQINGKGRYLTNVQVHPKNVQVSWGFNLDAAVDIPSLVNLGSVEQPVAGMQVDVKWEASSPLRKFNQSVSIFVQGDGPSKILK